MSDDRPCATHQWQDVPGEAGQYVCVACLATGYVGKHGGGVVAHRIRRPVKRKVTARPHHEYGQGAVPPKPRRS